MICPNCQSTLHAWCCARCGAWVRTLSTLSHVALKSERYCTDACADAQAREDAASAEMESTLSEREARAVGERITEFAGCTHNGERGTRGGIRKGWEVCMLCGDTVRAVRR